MNNPKLHVLLPALALLLVSQSAHAYVDPGSGAVIMTAILGFFAAIGYTTRKYFYKIKRRLGAKGDDQSGQSSTAAEASGGTKHD